MRHDDFKLTHEDLISTKSMYNMITELLDSDYELNAWENNFLYHIYDQLESNGNLSIKQLSKLAKIGKRFGLEFSEE